MIDGGYLIPANTKNGQLIFGIFAPPDLIIFASGIVASVLLLVAIGADSTIKTITCLAPGLICAFLVMPIPNYRNTRMFVKSMVQFLTGQRIYKWRGWCFYGFDRKK